MIEKRANVNEEPAVKRVCEVMGKWQCNSYLRAVMDGRVCRAQAGPTPEGPWTNTGRELLCDQSGDGPVAVVVIGETRYYLRPGMDVIKYQWPE